MNTCQPAEGFHWIPKGSELCVCGRTSRTFPDPRDFEAWKRLWDSAAEAELSKPARAEAAAPEPGRAPEVPEAVTAESPAAEAPKPAPKKSRSKGAPAAPAAPAAP